MTVLFSLQAQTPSFNFQKLGSEEGLNNANIFNIEQHQNGLMYFTTQNGIYYYDGYTFNKLDIDSLQSNALQTVKIKNEDELYLSLRDEGIATFNLRTGEFGPDLRLRIKDNNADNFIITEKYAYLLTSEVKLVIIDLATKKVLPDTLKNGDRTNLAYCLYQTKKGTVLVGRSNGLYDVTNGHQKRLEVLNDQPVFSITQDKSGRLIAGGIGKIYVIAGNKIEKEIIPTYAGTGTSYGLEGERRVTKLLADDFGRIWFTAYPGENLNLLQNNTVYDLFAVLDIPPSLINCITMDSHQNIWIGTFSDGVYFIQNTFFNSVNFTYNNKSLTINQVHLEDNLLIAATSNGLYGMNLATGHTRTLSHPDEVFMEPISDIVPSQETIFYVKRNQMNVSPSILMEGNNIYRFRPVSARQFYPMGQDRSIIADWEANILLCNHDGSVTLDTLISFTDYRISVNALLKIDSLLYVATSNGLFQYNFATKKYQNLVRAELNFNINDLSLINGQLYAAHGAGITNVYTGQLIQNAGKFRLSSVKKIRHFSDEVWLATLDGVFICDNKLNLLKTLNKSNGLLSNSCNDISFNDQTVSIATARGVSTTDFRNIIRYSSKLRPVTINYISSGGQRLPTTANSFSLEASQEDLTIYFYSPFYNRPNKQFFKYRLDRADWKYMESLTQFNFPTLAGGFHEIEISASADNIVWSDSTIISIFKEEKLSEKPSVYWFITLGSLLVLSAISFLWIRNVKLKGKRRLEQEQQINLLKHQAMNALLSPHFIFNSLTSIQNYINTNNSLRASEYLAKFSRLIRMIIEKAAQTHISLHDELARLTYYLELEKERFKNKFDYEIHIDENINTHELMIPNMIIQPHVENCILHGILPKQQHGVLSISFRKPSAKKLEINIEDNGIGLIKAAEHSRTGHKSLGTSTIRNILEINSKLSGKKQKVTMTDKSTADPAKNGTLITIELEL